MQVLNFDVVCIGGGGAAVAAAVTAARKAKVALISKEPVGYGDTRLAMGATAHPCLAPGDAPEIFYEDLLAGGEQINDTVLARLIVKEAPVAVDMLENFGCLFKRDAGGGFGPSVVLRPGGHSFPRAVTTPGKGVAIGGALRAALARAGVAVIEEAAVYRLLVNQQRIAGVVCYCLRTGEIALIKCKAIVLAAGGGGWLYYPQTDCSRGTTGDAYSLAYRAGAELVDMEQVQFIPFALTHPSSMRGIFLGEPSLAGPAGVLLDKSGQLVLKHINTMTRAQVTRAIVEALVQGRGTERGGLFLDLSANLQTEKGRQAWADMGQNGQLEAVRMAYGDKAYHWEEPWEVAPTAHYFMGGIKVNRYCESSIKGLFAAGQSQGGVHGANRLGSVSLAELFVFGRIAGEAAAFSAREAGEIDMPENGEEIIRGLTGFFGARGTYRPLQLQRELQQTMVEWAGPGRTAQSLRAALDRISLIENLSKDLTLAPHREYNLEVLEAIELEHMLVTARAVVESAMVRQESRGAHIRLDYPKTDNKYLGNVVTVQVNGQMEVRFLGVTKV
ncbi:MAG: FAD-binding protein [Bacillota bacterium]